MVQERYELPEVQVSDSQQKTNSKMLEEVHSSSIAKSADSIGQGLAEVAKEGLSDGASKAAGKGIALEAVKVAEHGIKGAADAIKNGAIEGALNSIGDAQSEGKQYFKDEISKFTIKVTEKDRAAAKEKLDGTLSSLIPEQDRKTLTAIQHAIVDGDVNAFAKAVQSLKDQPEKLKAFMKEVEKNLKGTDSGTHVAVSKDGKVLLYQNYGSTAVEVGTDGSIGVRPVSTRSDGSAVLEPGEVLGKEPADCMKDISEDMVRNMTSRPIRYFDNYIKPAIGSGKTTDWLNKLIDDK